IIKALNELRKTDIYYIICGKGSLNNYLMKLARKYNLEKNVLLLGYQKNMAEIYKIVDLFVFPSKREGLPVSLLEALASGLPVVCSKIRGNLDLIDSSMYISLVESNDVSGYSKSIEKYYDSHNQGINELKGN